MDNLRAHLKDGVGLNEDDTEFLSERCLKDYHGLHRACADGQLDKVTEILEDKDKISLDEEQHGVTSLHLASAVHNDHTVFVVDALLQAGAAVNRKSNPEMDTALTVAVAHLDPPDVEDVALLLLKKNADVSCRNQKLRNAYDIALERGFYKLSTLFGEDWSLEDATDFYVERNAKLFGEKLIVAIQEGSFDRSKLCVMRGANVNHVNEKGAGPIHYVITHYSADKEKILRLLKNNKLDVNLTDYEGDTALNLVIKGDQLRVDKVQYRLAEILLEWGTDPTYKDLDGKDATQLAEERNYDDILELLGRLRFNIHEWVTSKPVEDIRTELKKNSEKVNTPNEGGLYPIHLATGGREGDVDDTIACIDLLLEFGADINAQTKGKHTALHIAAEGNEKEIVEYLIMKGADTELRNDEGLTALELAKKLNLKDMEKCLQDAKAKKEALDKLGKQKKTNAGWCLLL